eukprot:IDg16287t1
MHVPECFLNAIVAISESNMAQFCDKDAKSASSAAQVVASGVTENEDAAVTVAETTAARPRLRKKRFVFREIYDILVLHTLSSKGAHVAAWEKKDVLLDEAR